MHFIAALHTALYTAPFEHPARRGGPLHEWLIVQRPDAETLTISLAGGAPPQAPGRAPEGLRARDTRIGTLIVRDPEAGTETFLLTRHLPRGVVLPEGEVFFPAEGYAVLSMEGTRPRLQGAGRHAHAHQISGGRFVPLDSPGEAAEAASAFAWQFDATHVPWVRETLPPCGARERVAL